MVMRMTMQNYPDNAYNQILRYFHEFMCITVKRKDNNYDYDHIQEVCKLLQIDIPKSLDKSYLISSDFINEVKA